MRTKLLIYLAVLTLLDGLLLYLFNQFQVKYFITLHGTLWVLAWSIYWLYQYLQNTNREIIGLGVTAALFIKMTFILIIFIILENKINLSKLQIINFLFINFAYSISFLTAMLRSQN